MKATGQFFLRMHASAYADVHGIRMGVLLPVVERDPNDHRVVLNQLVVRWKGPEALAFFDAHQAEMRAGRGLDLELDRLHGRDGEWQARAVVCSLAALPPSWQRAAAAKDDAAQPPLPTTPPLSQAHPA